MLLNYPHAEFIGAFLIHTGNIFVFTTCQYLSLNMSPATVPADTVPTPRVETLARLLVIIADQTL
jgi:hypothetical protein